MSEIGGIPMGWIVLLFIVVYCFMLNAVMNYADRKGRDKTFWVFIGIVFSPIIATFCYSCMVNQKSTEKKESLRKNFGNGTVKQKLRKLKRKLRKNESKKKRLILLIGDMYRS